jgi:hypothetical protein
MTEVSRRGVIGGLLSLIAAGSTIARSAASAMIGSPSPAILWPASPIFAEGDLLYSGMIIREMPQDFNQHMSKSLSLLGASENSDPSEDDEDEGRSDYYDNYYDDE